MGRQSARGEYRMRTCRFATGTVALPASPRVQSPGYMDGRRVNPAMGAVAPASRIDPATVSVARTLHVRAGPAMALPLHRPQRNGNQTPARWVREMWGAAQLAAPGSHLLCEAGAR